jgi:hypothetical protein
MQADASAALLVISWHLFTKPSRSGSGEEHFGNLPLLFGERGVRRGV